MVKEEIVQKDYKKHKQCRKSDIPSSLEELEKRSKQERDNQRTGIPTISTKSIRKAIRSIGKPIDKARRLFKNLRRCEVVTTIDDTDEDVTFQQTQVIASTPYNTLKHYQHDSEQSLPASPIDFQPRRSNNTEFNSLRSSSSLILSHNQELDNKRSRDDHTDADIGPAYSTADIMDVLGETKEPDFTSRLEYTAQKEETFDDGLVTRNIDYSAGDILEVLGDSIQIIYTYSETVLTDSASDIAIHTWNGGSNTDFSKFNFLENDSHTCSTRCIVSDKPSGTSCVCESQKTLSQLYSLPTKSKNKMENCSAKVLSVDKYAIEQGKQEHNIDLSKFGNENVGYVLPAVLQTRDKHRHNCYRSNSYMSAISNRHCDRTSRGSAVYLLSPSGAMQSDSNQDLYPGNNVNVHKGQHLAENLDYPIVNVVAYF